MLKIEAVIIKLLFFFLFFILSVVFLSCLTSTDFTGKGIPRVPQLSFTIQSGFLLFPPHGTPQTRRRSKLAGRSPQKRGLPLLRADWDAWIKAGSGEGIPQHAGRDGDDRAGT